MRRIDIPDTHFFKWIWDVQQWCDELDASDELKVLGVFLSNVEYVPAFKHLSFAKFCLFPIMHVYTILANFIFRADPYYTQTL